MPLIIQEIITLTIVGIAIGVSVRHLYRKYGAQPLARFFLRRGKVRLAMRIRDGKMTASRDCGKDCGCD